MSPHSFLPVLPGRYPEIDGTAGCFLVRHMVLQILTHPHMASSEIGVYPDHMSSLLGKIMIFPLIYQWIKGILDNMNINPYVTYVIGLSQIHDD
jgi:hypothetical protein